MLNNLIIPNELNILRTVFFLNPTLFTNLSPMIPDIIINNQKNIYGTDDKVPFCQINKFWKKV